MTGISARGLHVERGTSRPTAPAGGEAAATGVGPLEGTTPLFYLYLLVLVIEYLGLGDDIPILKVSRFSTISIFFILAVVLAKVGGEAFTRYRQSRLVGVFVLYAFLTLPIAVITSTALWAARTYVDDLALVLVTAYLVDRPARVRAVAATGAFIVVFLVTRNVSLLGSSGRAFGMRTGYFLNDGNDFAWGMTVLMPWCIFLALTRQGLLLRALGAAGAVAALFGIVGSQSRGGTLALAGMALFYWVFLAKRKMLGVVVIVAAIGIVLVVAPPGYFQRIQSIQNYEEDNSAQARLQAWSAATRMAIGFPLGVGANNFGSAYGRYYIPKGDANVLGWGAGRWLSPHSVYFRLLGECGILGVVWILTLIIWSYNDNMAAHRALSASSNADTLSAAWPLMLNMSLIGYAVSGIFLGGIAYPHLYWLSGLIVSAKRHSEWAQAQSAASTVLPVHAGSSRTPVVIPEIRIPPGPARGAARPVLNIADRARLALNSRPRRRQPS